MLLLILSSWSCTRWPVDLLFALEAETGVTNDKQTMWASWVMIGTLTPYLVAQIPRLFGLNTRGHAFIAAATVIAALGLIGYCIYQVGLYLHERFVRNKIEKFSFFQSSQQYNSVQFECRLRRLGFRKEGSNMQCKDTGKATLFTGFPNIQEIRAGVVFLNLMVNPMRRCWWSKYADVIFKRATHTLPLPRAFPKKSLSTLYIRKSRN